jgi:hypothetical protein
MQVVVVEQVLLAMHHQAQLLVRAEQAFHHQLQVAQ